MSLSDYLAKNYLTADPGTVKQSKKRKRQSQQLSATGPGLRIADDDASGWKTAVHNGDDDIGPTLGMSEHGPLSHS